MSEKILIYNDLGVSLQSFKYLFSLFEKQPVSSIDAEGLLHTSWEKKCKLLIFPGGRDIPYHRSLKGEGNARIRSFVEEGGNYLGICAGAYYGSAFIEFEKGGGLEIIDSRELAFFPGTAIGPAYGRGKFCYETEQGARAAPISWRENQGFFYFNGGCYFANPGSYPHIEVLATYNDLPHTPAAIVRCHVGKGSALLSGVHFEYPSRSTQDLLAYLAREGISPFKGN